MLVESVLSQDRQIKPQLAAILVAMQEYLALPPGSFRIDKIEPIEQFPISTQPQLAAMSAARRAGIQSVGTVNAWKMAGRLEIMGIGGD